MHNDIAITLNFDSIFTRFFSIAAKHIFIHRFDFFPLKFIRILLQNYIPTTAHSEYLTKIFLKNIKYNFLLIKYHQTA